MGDDPVRTFVEACRDYESGEPTAGLRAATQVFLGWALGDPALLARAAEALPELPPKGAAWLAVTFGTATEEGAPPAAAGPALLAFFRSFLAELPATPAADDAKTPEPTAEQSARLAVLPWICQSVVAHLARMPKERGALGRDQELLDRLQALSDHVFAPLWVREALVRTSGPLVVLHPLSKTGFTLHYTNVANCFHLFSLVQCALGTRVPGGKDPDPEITEVARELRHANGHDTAWWHYGDPGSPEPRISASIWGEARVGAIPVVDGVQVMLLWPPLLGSRGWDSGFFGPQLAAMPPDVVVERQLTEAECRRWFERLGIVERPETPTS